jgi:hypothetical protein
MAVAQDLCHGLLSSSVQLFHELALEVRAVPSRTKASDLRSRQNCATDPCCTSGKRATDVKGEEEEASLHRVVSVITGFRPWRHCVGSSLLSGIS